MGFGRAVARACKEVASRRWQLARNSLVTPLAAGTGCMHTSSKGSLQANCLPAPATVTLIGSSSSASAVINSRSFSQGVELEALSENDDDPIMRMSFRTMDHDVMSEEQFQTLWRKIHLRPTKALKIIHTWIDRGNPLSKEGVINICLKLCYIRRQIRALQVIDWVVEDKPFTLTPKEYGFQIRLTCRYASPIKGERLYDRVPAEMKTDEVATALITSLSRSDVMCKAETWYKSLKVRSAPICNMMMILFLRRNRHQEVRQIYEDLLTSGAEPNPLTYLILLKYKDRIGGLEGIEKQAEAALSKLNIHDKDMKEAILSDMMVVYAYLGKSDKVELIWSILKKETWTLAGRFVSAINAFGILGKVDRAEKALDDVLRTRKRAIQKPYCTMLGVYCKHGMMDKAEKTMEALRKHLSFPWFAPYNHLVMGYLAKDEPDKAYAKLQEGWNYVPANKRIVPEYDMVVGMMPVFASKKDVAGAEKLMELFGSHGDARLYNELLKVYVAAEASPGRFLHRMKCQNVEPDDETKRLIESEVVSK